MRKRICWARGGLYTYPSKHRSLSAPWGVGDREAVVGGILRLQIDIRGMKRYDREKEVVSLEQAIECIGGSADAGFIHVDGDGYFKIDPLR